MGGSYGLKLPRDYTPGLHVTEDTAMDTDQARSEQLTRPLRRMRDGMVLSLVVPISVGAAITAILVWAIEQMVVPILDPSAYVLATGLTVTVAVTVVVDIQKRVGGSTHAHLRDMERRARHDALTGLPGRDEIRDRLDGALKGTFRHDGIIGVLFLDLDGFKAINDSMGHEAGDKLLIAFADRLRQSVRAEDIVGRFGGDEFVVVCTGLERESALREVADNIRAAFSASIQISDGAVLMTPSIGIATASRSKPATAVELIVRADQAMYRAKRARLGIQFFDDEQRREQLDRLEVERAIVPALADGQFQVYYQPIVSEREARTVGLEGLIRWRHPIHGVIGPDRFLAVAEESGLVARLGEVVLREVAAQTSVWNHLFGDAKSFNVSVNLAERQLVDPSFPDRIAEIVHWGGISPTQLDLEVPEALLLRRAHDSSRVLQRLAALGCRIVIDDFGNSHGAFSKIRELDIVSVIKIDRSVIGRLGLDDVSRAVVEATMSMASVLDVTVIAEGVETEIQRQMVTDLGIDLMQGFLFQAPSPAEVFDRGGPALDIPATIALPR